MRALACQGWLWTRTLCRYNPRDRGRRDVGLQHTLSPMGLLTLSRLQADMGRAMAQSHHQHRCRAGGLPLCCSRDSSPKLPRALTALWVLIVPMLSTQDGRATGSGAEVQASQQLESSGPEIPTATSLCLLPSAHAPFPRSGCPRSTVRPAGALPCCPATASRPPPHGDIDRHQL